MLAFMNSPTSATYMSICNTEDDMSNDHFVLAKDDKRGLSVFGSLLHTEMNQVKLAHVTHAEHSVIKTIKHWSLYESVLVIDAADAWCGSDFFFTALGEHMPHVDYLEIDHGFQLNEIIESITDAFKACLPTHIIVVDAPREALTKSVRSSFSAHICGAVSQGVIQMKRRGRKPVCIEFCVDPMWNRQNTMSFILASSDEVSASHLSMGFITDKFDTRIV
jgi:hypothetical protein